MKRSMWATTGVALLVACGGTGPVVDPNPELAPIVTVTAPTHQTVIITAPSTTAPSPLDSVDLGAVDWEGLDFLAQEEARIARQAEIDEARAIYGQCGEWRSLALEVGWTEDQWPWLSGVIYRESRCQADAWNGHDAGLVQINQIHREWLSQNGWIHPDSMFDPRANLTFAKMLYDASGCRPWRNSNSCPEQ
jgi:hypothetical protein